MGWSRGERDVADRTDKEPGERGRDGAERRRAFLGFVAHEVRNPLSTALWSAAKAASMAASAACWLVRGEGSVCSWSMR